MSFTILVTCINELKLKQVQRNAKIITVMKNQAYEKRLKDLTYLYEESFNFVKLNIWGFGRCEKRIN